MIKPLFRFLNTDGLLKDSSVLLVGMAIAHVFNLLFQMFMGRRLVPEEFALLIALLGVFNVLSLPLTVISSAINRSSSLLIKEGRRGDIPRLLSSWGWRLVAAGGVASLVCFIYPYQIAGFFYLERPAPVYIFGIILTGMFCRPLVNGALLGMQRFDGWCLGTVLGAMVRLFIGGLLVVTISPFSGWGLLGHGLGFYMTILVGGWIVFRSLRGTKRSHDPLPAMKQFMFGSFFILLGYSFLMTGDVILVKHLFPESAGDFAYAATLGRLVLFVPQALGGSMFPKVVSAKEGSSEQVHLLRKTMLIAFMGSVVTASIFSGLTGYILLLVFNIQEPSNDLLKWLPMLSWMMVPVAMLNIVVRFALAQHKLGHAFIVPVAAVCYWLGAIYWTGNPTMLLALLGAITGAVSLVLGYVLAFRSGGIARRTQRDDG